MANFAVVLGVIGVFILGEKCVISTLLGYHVAICLILIRIMMLINYCSESLDEFVVLSEDEDEDMMIYHPPYEVESENDDI